MSTMRVLLVLALLAIASTLSAATSEVVLKNDRVEIVKVVAEPAHVTGDHQHKINRVMIYLDKGGQVVTYKDDGKIVEETWAAGQVLWSPAEGLHRVAYRTDWPVSLVKIELQRHTPLGAKPLGPLDPLKVDPGHYAVELENEQVRVIRVKVAEGGSIPLHEHARQRAVVYLTDADFEQVLADGRRVESHQKRGDVVWSETPVRHRERNLGGAFEGLVVELK